MERHPPTSLALETLLGVPYPRVAGHDSSVGNIARRSWHVAYLRVAGHDSSVGNIARRSWRVAGETATRLREQKHTKQREDEHVQRHQ